jgi:hypothetical protein
MARTRVEYKSIFPKMPARKSAPVTTGVKTLAQIKRSKAKISRLERVHRVNRIKREMTHFKDEAEYKENIIQRIRLN